MRINILLIFAFVCFFTLEGQTFRNQQATDKMFNFQIAGGFGYKSFKIEGYHFSVCPQSIDSTPISYRNNQNLNTFSPYFMANGSIRIARKIHFQLIFHLSHFQIKYDNYVPEELNNCPTSELVNSWTDIEISRYLLYSGVGIAYQPFDKLMLSLGTTGIYREISRVDYTLVLSGARKSYNGTYQSFSYDNLMSSFYLNGSYQFYKSFLLHTSFHFRNRFVNVGFGYQF